MAAQAIPAPTVRLTGPNRRAQLTEVATALFAERGFAGTTMDDVAQAAGVTKPVVYHHFSSKQALYDELVDKVAAELVVVISDAAVAAGSPRRQVEDGMAAYFSYVADHREAFFLLYGRDGRSDRAGGDPMAAIEDVIIEVVDPLIDADLDPRYRRVLASAVVSMAEGVARRWLRLSEGNSAMSRHDEAQDLARAVAALAWGGLRTVGDRA